jgi:hypothetical protein
MPVGAFKPVATALGSGAFDGLPGWGVLPGAELPDGPGRGLGWLGSDTRGPASSVTEGWGTQVGGDASAPAAQPASRPAAASNQAGRQWIGRMPASLPADPVRPLVRPSLTSER